MTDFYSDTPTPLGGDNPHPSSFPTTEREQDRSQAGSLARREFRRILLIKPSSPGDILHALPVLHGLRLRYPSAHLAWLVATPFANLIEADPALNEVLRFDRRRFGKLVRHWSVAREFNAFLRGLRGRRFDLVIDLQGLFRSGFLAMASGAAVRIGFRRARELAWMFYTHRLCPVAAVEHAADRNYEAARVLGFAEHPMDFTVTLLPADRARAAALLRSENIDERKYIVMAPATRWETKTWSAERYGYLAALLRERHRMRTILVGGGGDATLGEQAASGSAGAAANLCGKTSLRELAALIAGAKMVVTADSTPMHLAAALNRPMVALFGPTNPARTGPYGRTKDVLRLDLPCSPCYLRKLRECRHEHACMRDLTVERVAAAVMERLDASVT